MVEEDDSERWADGDPQGEHRKWDRVSDPPEPGETVGSWDRGVRDRVVAGLVLSLFVAYGAFRADAIAASPTTAALYGATAVATFSLHLPDVRDRIPWPNSRRATLRVAWLLPLALVAHVEAGRGVALVAFVAVIWVGMAVVSGLAD